MPSAAAFGRMLEHGDDLDDYGLDDSDNPFASPSPPPESTTKKRKEPDSGLGIEEEVSVQKRARVPAVKLDEERLLGPAGIPKLRKRAAGLRLKGKGHEFSDASRLLSFYQLWLDDLFPKARFLDALAMVEKTGHKKALVTARSEWINEGRSKASNNDDGDLDIGAVATAEDSQVITTQRGQKTPERDDAPNDDDLYGATPRGPTRTTNALLPAPSNDSNDAPDDDDLEALMAEAESMDNRQGSAVTKQKSTPNTHQPDEGDDLDAFIAEAEAQDGLVGQAMDKSTGVTSSKQQGLDFVDDEEAMQEMEGLW